MTHGLVGGYNILAQLPIWAMATMMYFVTIGVLFVGRYIFEGFDYNISWSSQQGDVALIGIILIGMTLVQAGADVSSNFYNVVSRVALVAGLGYLVVMLGLYLFAGRKDTVMDGYHNLVTVPLFVCLLILSLPVVFGFGSIVERSTTIFFIFIWVVTYLYDSNTGRLQQRSYLAGQGIRPHSAKWLKWYESGD